MSLDPAERYQSARELRDALARIGTPFEDTPTVVRPTSPKRSAPLLLRWGRYRTAAAVGTGVLVLALVATVVFRRVMPSRSPEQPPVVAVVPLSNLSGDPSIDHIGIGIAHTLTTKLSAIPSVTTVSRAATLEFASEARDVRSLARDLGATFIVTGSVQSVADALQVTVNLVRDDDSIVWGGAFTGRMSELFDIQSELASGLVTGLQLNLTPDETEALEEAPTENVDAYAEFSQGRSFLERIHDPENIDRAIGLLESAVGRDPEFVLAHAALSEAYWQKFERTTDSTWTDKARASAEQARRLRSDHPAVRYALANIYYETGEVDRAIEELERTLTLQPNYDDAHALLGAILAGKGRVDEGAAEIEKAIETRPNFWGHYNALGLVYFRAGRLEDAVPAFRRVTELQPDLPNGFQSLGATYHSMGALEQAVSNYKEAIERGNSWVALSNLGTIYYRQGRFAEAAEQFERAIELNPNRHVYHRNLGDAYARLERREDARASYRRAKNLSLKQLGVNPNEAPMKSFLALCEAKLGNLSEARRLVSEASALAPENPDVQYDAAVVHALAGQRDEAIFFLRNAIENGYSRSEAGVDDDIASIRDAPEVQRLLTATE